MEKEVGSKSRRLATPVKILTLMFVYLREFKLGKMNLNLNYTLLNGEMNCAFKPPTLYNSQKYKVIKKSL